MIHKLLQYLCICIIFSGCGLLCNCPELPEDENPKGSAALENDDTGSNTLDDIIDGALDLFFE